MPDGAGAGNASKQRRHCRRRLSRAGGKPVMYVTGWIPACARRTAPLASRWDAECRDLHPPVVFAALDHRLMAFILSGYESTPYHTRRLRWPHCRQNHISAPIINAPINGVAKRAAEPPLVSGVNGNAMKNTPANVIKTVRATRKRNSTDCFFMVRVYSTTAPGNRLEGALQHVFYAVGVHALACFLRRWSSCFSMFCRTVGVHALACFEDVILLAVEHDDFFRLTASRRRLRLAPTRTGKAKKRSRLRLAVKRATCSHIRYRSKNMLKHELQRRG